MASEAVLVAQSVLYNAGMLPAAPDGYWGPQSRFALLLFQEKNGLFADGILNEETYNKLREFAKTEFDREDGLNETTKSILYIQKMLESLKLLENDVANYYGPKTFAAVSKFQSMTKDLVVDGLAGPRTKAALKAAVQSSDKTDIPTDNYSARKKWSNHPNASRVSSWMSFHQSLREEVGEIRDKWRDIENLQDLLASKKVHRADVIDLVGKVQPKFEKLMNKLNSHAQFEDTALFLFFQDIKTESLVHQLPILTAQHSELDSIENVIKGLLVDYTNLLEEGRSSDQCKTICTRIKTHISDYQNLIIEHLSIEETSILIPWLNLSDDQYQSYLTYYLNAGTHSLPKEEEINNLTLQTKAASKEQKPKPVLRDIYGRRVDPFSGGCCFAGETTCCKSSALLG